LGAQLNIKSEDAYQLASRLAALTGGSLTNAVTNAPRSELEWRDRTRDIDDEVERMLAMDRETRTHMTERASSGLSDFHYENGFSR
jgi:antitoxin VapB